MKVLQGIVAGAVIMTGAGAHAQTSGKELAMNDKPEWFQIVGDGTTSGTACPVRSLASREVIGVAQPQFRFLTFGGNRDFLVFGYQGVMAYVPAAAAEILYPLPLTTNQQYRSGGKTLEELAEERRKRAQDVKDSGSPLSPNFTNQPTPKPTYAPAAVGGVPGSFGGGGKEGAAI